MANREKKFLWGIGTRAPRLMWAPCIARSAGAVVMPLMLRRKHSEPYVEHVVDTFLLLLATLPRRSTVLLSPSSTPCRIVRDRLVRLRASHFHLRL